VTQSITTARPAGPRASSRPVTTLTRALLARGLAAGPVFIGVYGAALISAGVFLADPADGFPPGTPPGRRCWGHG
jgi:hypothetical protein